MEEKTEAEPISSAGLSGALIPPYENLSTYESHLQELSNEELLKNCERLLRECGDPSPPASLASTDSSREGLIDLLVGLYALWEMSIFPETGGGRNNSQPPVV